MPESFFHALSELWNPQYLHVVLQPLLVHGLLLCGLFLLGSLVLRQKRAAALGLVLLALCALAVFPFGSARACSLAAMQAAHTKYEATEIAATGEYVRSLAWIYYTTAGSAALALLLLPVKSKLSTASALLAALLAIGTGIWGLDMHHREATIAHPNLLKQTLRGSPAAPVPAPVTPTSAAPAPAPHSR